MSHKLMSAALCCVSLATVAEEAKTAVEKSPYTASAELGMLFKTGDTKSGDIKAGFDLGHELDAWKSTLQFDMLVKKTEKEMNALQKVISDVEQKLADNSLYEAAEKERLKALLAEQAAAKSELELVEMAWLEASGAIELAAQQT